MRRIIEYKPDTMSTDHGNNEYLRSNYKSKLLPAKDDRKHCGVHWRKLERLTLAYGRLSKWTWVDIAEAIAAVYQGNRRICTCSSCSSYWNARCSRYNVAILLQEDTKLAEIEKWLKGLGKAKFQDGLCLDHEESQLLEEKRALREWMDITEAEFRKAGAQTEESQSKCSEEDILKCFEIL